MKLLDSKRGGLSERKMAMKKTQAGPEAVALKRAGQRSHAAFLGGKGNLVR